MNIKSENISNFKQVKADTSSFYLDNLSNLNKNKESGWEVFSSMLENFSNTATFNKEDIKRNTNINKNDFREKDIENRRLARKEDNFKDNFKDDKKIDRKESLKEISRETNFRETKKSDKKISNKKSSNETKQKEATSEESNKINKEQAENKESNKINSEKTNNIEPSKISTEDVKELVQKIINILEATKKFTNDEILKIKDALESGSFDLQKFNLKDFLYNLKEAIEGKSFTNLELNKFIKDVSKLVNELQSSGKIDVAFLESVLRESTKEKEQINSDIKVRETSKDKLNITSVFEEVLKDILNSNLQGDNNERLQNFSSLYLNNNNLPNKNTQTDLLIEKFQTITRSLSGSYENSSMLNVEKNFLDTQNMVNALNTDAKNSIDLTAKKDVFLKTLDGNAQAKVLERVADVLKTISSSKDGSSISLRLDPPSLGEVKVDMTYKNGNLFARIIADNKEVENLLKSKAAELQQILRDSGIDANKINVFIASKDNYENRESKNMSESNIKNDILKILSQSDDENSDARSDALEALENKNESLSRWIA